MKRSIKNLEKKEKLQIKAMSKIIGGQAEDGGFCLIDNISGRVNENDGGIVIVENVDV